MTDRSGRRPVEAPILGARLPGRVMRRIFVAESVVTIRQGRGAPGANRERNGELGLGADLDI